MMKNLPTENILGIPVTNAVEDQILEYIITRLGKKGEKTFVVTPNPEIVMLARRDAEYKKVLSSAQVALPDGVGLLWGARLMGKRLESRITGVDFMQKLCEEASKQGLTVGFVGGREKVAERAAKCLKKSYPNLTVLFHDECEEEFLRSGKEVDMLFVALGAPKQEMWIYENLSHLNVKMAMGVGGAFDFLSGSVGRAPSWIRKIGLEWLYRLIRQPWRLRRQLALPQFAWGVVALRLKKGR